MINNSSGRLTQDIIETITLFNDGPDAIKEVILEMEEYRNELKIFDEEWHLIPLLTKDELKEYLPKNTYSQLIEDKIFLAGLPLPASLEIKPKTRKTIVMQYKSFSNIQNVRYNGYLPSYGLSNFYVTFSFFENETFSLSINFEEGITHRNGLIIIPVDKQGEYITDYSAGEKFHYVENQHNLTLSISIKKREEKEIISAFVLYSVIPDPEYRTLIGGITLFSITFPVFIILFYFRFNSLSLFGIMSTTELLSIVSIGISRFPSTLISIRRRLFLSLLELFVVFVVILTPHVFLLYLWTELSHFFK